MSIAGGLQLAIERGHALGCSAVQIFLKNQRQWAAPPLREADVRAFRAARQASGMRTVFAHASYLINLASPGSGRVAAGRQRLHRRARARGGAGAGLRGDPSRLASGRRDRGRPRSRRRGGGRGARRTRGYRVRVVLENTAGGGASIGRSFEELAALLPGCGRPARRRVLDTCHLFAAGYDLRSRRATGRPWRNQPRGRLSRVLAFHLNDAGRRWAPASIATRRSGGGGWACRRSGC